MRRTLAARLAVAWGVAAAALDPGCASPDPTQPDSSDTDGDGLSDRDEIYIYGTSPVLIDTDGDGWTDFDEIVKQAFNPESDPYRFNPRVADMPELGLEINSVPVVRILATEANGTVHTFDTSRADTTSQTDTTSQSSSDAQTNSQSVSQTQGHDVSITIPIDPPPADAGAGGGDAAADNGGSSGGSSGSLTVTDSQSVTDNPSTTVATAVTFTQEQALQNSVTLTQAEGYAESNDVTAITGQLRLTASIQNKGHVTFRITNILLGATITEHAGVHVPVGNLYIENPYTNFQPFPVAPGASVGPINFIRDGITLDGTRALLADATGLVILLGSTELSDADGKVFAFSATQIGSKTASVDIEYAGLRPTEHYRVATNLDPASPGVTTGMVLRDILRIPYEWEPATGGLTSIRGVTARSSDAGTWMVERIHHEGGAPVITPYGESGASFDFDGIELQAGDGLYLALVKR